MSDNSGLVRAFIAIELPPLIRLALAQLQDRLRHHSHIPAKWVPAENIHLTLQFLGAIPQAALEKATQVMPQAVIEQAVFQLTLDKLGVFPDFEKPKVLWIGLSNELSKLKSLQEKLTQLLRLGGFTLEERRFYPHLTLARVRDEASYDEKRSLRQVLNTTELTPVISFNVHDISLIQSQLTSQGPIYHTLHQANLQPL